MRQTDFSLKLQEKLACEQSTVNFRKKVESFRNPLAHENKDYNGNCFVILTVVGAVTMSAIDLQSYQ